VCLAEAQVLLSERREHHWLRMCYARLGLLLPCLPKRPGYHKRLVAERLAGITVVSLECRLASSTPILRPDTYDAVQCGAPRKPAASTPPTRPPAHAAI